MNLEKDFFFKAVASNLKKEKKTLTPDKFTFLS